MRLENLSESHHCYHQKNCVTRCMTLTCLPLAVASAHLRRTSLRLGLSSRDAATLCFEKLSIRVTWDRNAAGPEKKTECRAGLRTRGPAACFLGFPRSTGVVWSCGKTKSRGDLRIFKIYFAAFGCGRNNAASFPWSSAAAGDHRGTWCRRRRCWKFRGRNVVGMIWLG